METCSVCQKNIEETIEVVFVVNGQETTTVADIHAALGVPAHPESLRGTGGIMAQESDRWEWRPVQKALGLQIAHSEKELTQMYKEILNSRSLEKALEDGKPLVQEMNKVHGRRMYHMYSNESFDYIVVTESISNRSDSKGLA